MKINGKDYTTIWLEAEERCVQTIDQRCLPHQLEIFEMNSSADAIFAIKEMVVRGAPLIGVTAAFGVYLAAKEYDGDDLIAYLYDRGEALKASRPTAVNLAWAVEQQLALVTEGLGKGKVVTALKNGALNLKQIDIDICYQIGQHGKQLIAEIARKKNGEPVNILTHCNAGWLACIDWGTATSSIYQAQQDGIAVHVWVDETRPRNQGAKLTAFEFVEQGIPHTVIPDNTGGHLMQHGMVDLVIVGTDRTSRKGDVANKIGTYLKALAAYDNQLPFYVALPSPTIDWSISDGLAEIPIEKRSEDEVKYMSGLSENGIQTVLVTPEKSPAANYGFDVTPARLVSGLITERGICEASEEGLLSLFHQEE